MFVAIHFTEGDVHSIAFGREVEVQNATAYPAPGSGVLCGHVKKVVQTCPVLIAVELRNIEKFAVIEGVDNKDFIMKLPNTFDRD